MRAIYLGKIKINAQETLCYDELKNYCEFHGGAYCLYFNEDITDDKRCDECKERSKK